MYGKKTAVLLFLVYTESRWLEKALQSRSESEKTKKKEGGGKTAFFLAIFMLVLALAGKYYIMKLARGDNSSKSVHSAQPHLQLTDIRCN